MESHDFISKFLLIFNGDVNPKISKVDPEISVIFHSPFNTDSNLRNVKVLTNFCGS